MYLFSFCSFSDFLMYIRNETDKIQEIRRLSQTDRYVLVLDKTGPRALVSCQASGTKHLHRERCITNI